MKDYAYILKGLDCEHCAARLQRKIAELEGVEHVSVSYPSCMCTFEAEEASLEAVFALIHAEEEEVEIVPAEGECSC
ncbi:MAG: heavy-metal-associated domain-containing protein, partial [Solobacterium sp.]|nr:heavy-metal-associated domain-containing protein [Solobacterium sp.]